MYVIGSGPRAVFRRLRLICSYSRSCSRRQCQPSRATCHIAARLGTSQWEHALAAVPCKPSNTSYPPARFLQRPGYNSSPPSIETTPSPLSSALPEVEMRSYNSSKRLKLALTRDEFGIQGSGQPCCGLSSREACPP